MLDKRIKIKDIRSLGASNYLLVLAAPEQARLTQPGQFVMLKCTADLDGPPLLRRPFSVFDVHPTRAGRPGGLDLLVKDVGLGTAHLVRMDPGEHIYVLGPQGRPFMLQPEFRSRVSAAYLVAGGVGIAALFLLAKKLVSLDVRTTLIYGGRSTEDLVLREPFESLGVETVYTTEDGSAGHRGVVTEPLAARLGGRPSPSVRIFTCGPWGMMKAVHTLALRHKIPCQVSLEARMGCSLGACMGCVVRSWDDKGEEQYVRVCQEGPVMNSASVDWDTCPF